MRMRDDLTLLLHRVDAALAESRGVVPDTELDSLASLAGDVRTRLAFPDDLALVALAGGTGSGKSSLLNALVGEDVAETGGLRPTTAAALAVVPSGREPSVQAFFDALGIERRHGWEGTESLCLIDLPDTDSVEVDHRHTVEAMLPAVDLIVWVVDPEKYRDAALHLGLIDDLKGYASQFAFVLNQVDRLAEPDRAAVAEDFSAVLARDGIRKPRIFLTSAAPPLGPPEGIDELRSYLERRARAKPAVEKLIIDLTEAGEHLARATGGGTSLDFEDRWASESAAAIEKGLGGAVAAAGHRLSAFVESLATPATGDLAPSIRALAAEVPAVLARAFGTAPVPPAESSGGGILRRVRSGALDPAEETRRGHVRRVLDDGIAAPLRRLLERRARATAAIADLVLILADNQSPGG